MARPVTESPKRKPEGWVSFGRVWWVNIAVVFTGQFRKAGANGAEDEIIGQFLRVPAGAAHQQAVFPSRLAVPRNDKAGPVIQPRPLGPLTGGKGRPVLIGKFLDHLRGVGGHDAPLADEPDMVIAANRQHIGLVPLLEHPPQAVIRAIGRIGQHPGTAHTGIKVPGNHPAGNRRLGGKLHIIGNAGLRTPAGITGPGLRKIELTVNQRLAISARITEKHAHLAVLDPAGRPRILADNANRMAPLLQETGIIDNKHTVFAAKRLHDISAYLVPQPVRIPAAAAKQCLHPPGTRQARIFGHHPAGLA